MTRVTVFSSVVRVQAGLHGRHPPLSTTGRALLRGGAGRGGQTPASTSGPADPRGHRGGRQGRQGEEALHLRGGRGDCKVRITGCTRKKRRKTDVQRIVVQG